MDDRKLRCIRAGLRQSCEDLSARGLYLASKWAAENLHGMAPNTDVIRSDNTDEGGTDDSSDEDSDDDHDYECEIAAPRAISSADISRKERDYIHLGQSLVLNGEYLRCAHMLRKQGSRAVKSHHGIFIANYSLYLAGEKLKHHQLVSFQPGFGTPVSKNGSSSSRSESKSSSDVHDSSKSIIMDSFLLYLLGVIVRSLTSLPLPSDLFLQSIRLYPWNWSCWLELIRCWSIDRSTNESLPLRESCYWIMYQHFLVEYHLEQQNGEGAFEAIAVLAEWIPQSHSLIMYRALAHFSKREYDLAQDAFELSRSLDPHQLAYMDSYSSILHVNERRAELSHLAHVVTKIDKFAPETCCVVGNYYSLKGKHERAITYFQRALKANPKFLSAWTLMGHECLELRNIAAAVQCYRTAVDLNPGDYRPWYGLGQTYEMLHLYQYALYYYRKVTALKPLDARMWSAVGACLVRLGAKHEAMLTFERAVSCGDSEGVATRELARLYRDEGKAREAASAARSTNSKMHNGEDKNPQSVEGALFLANYYRSLGEFPAAEAFCALIVDFVGPEGDEARAIVRDIRSVYVQQQTRKSTPRGGNAHERYQAFADFSPTRLNEDTILGTEMPANRSMNSRSSRGESDIAGHLSMSSGSSLFMSHSP
eukprot:GSChrysophyteH1.ASY1.ANO1.160.1 assembled CDS